MCGITGIFDLRGHREIDQSALRRMTDALTHRGPDGEGYLFEPGIGLGHRRLAVIDIDGGRQPFSSQCGRYSVTFNGEIYNFQHLTRKLSQKGSVLHTKSDTEALVETWAQSDHRNEKDILEAFDGMFAFGLWDRGRRVLTLARDRLGEKPLFYTVNGDGFLLFASEIGALVQSGLIKASISSKAVMDYFAYGYIPEENCIYEGIRKLPAGHFLSLSGLPTSSITRLGNLPKPQPYWHLHMQPDNQLTFNEASSQLVSLLDDVTNSQMVSDVPLGAFLSGGVDSSAIVAAMAHHCSHRIRTCSVGFNETSHDERAYAEEIATLFGTHHETRLAKLDPYRLIDVIAQSYGEPFADSSALPTYLVCQLASQSVTVALSGDGGDELFAGYRRYPFLIREQMVRAAIPDWLRQPIFGTAGRLYPKLDWAPRSVRFKTTFQSIAQAPYEAHMRAVAATPQDHMSGLFSQDFKVALKGYTPTHHLESLYHQADTDDPLLAAQYADIKSWLPGRMLTKIDRASMQHSLEVRPPLLSSKLVQWACTLPPSFKLKGRTGKYILKKSQELRLPHHILYRPKQGFGLPVAQWLRARNANPLEKLLTSSHWRNSGIFNEAQVISMVQNHRAGRANHEGALWAMIMYDAFLRTERVKCQSAVTKTGISF